MLTKMYFYVYPPFYSNFLEKLFSDPDSNNRPIEILDKKCLIMEISLLTSFVDIVKWSSNFDEISGIVQPPNILLNCS